MKNITCINRGVRRLAPIVLFLIPFTLFPPALQAQDWSSVQRQLERHQYRTVDSIACAQLARARAAGNARLELEAAYMLSQAEYRYQESPADSALSRYQSLLPRLQGPERALCLALMDSAREALKDSLLLQRTPATDYLLFFSQNSQPSQNSQTSHPQSLTPTLYDALVWHAMPTLPPHSKRHYFASLLHLHRGEPCLLVELILRDPRYQTPAEREAQLRQAIGQLRGSQCDHYSLLHYRLAAHLRDQGRLGEALAWCDSARVGDTLSEGARLAFNLRRDIEAPQVAVEPIVSRQPENQEIPLQLTARNCKKLYFRLVEDDRSNRKPNSRKPLRAWSLDLSIPLDYRNHPVAATLPPMQPGEYVLIVSPYKGFPDNCYSSCEYACDRFLIVTASLDRYRPEGYLLDRMTGRPIAGQNMELWQRTDWKHEARHLTDRDQRTDADGFFAFPEADRKGQFPFIVTYNQRHKTTRESGNGRWNYQRDTTYSYNIYLDQPIYRPGDTVRFTVLAFQGDCRTWVRTLAGSTLKAILRQGWGNGLDTLSLTLDSFGTASGLFALPDDWSKGNCDIRLYDGGDYLTNCIVWGEHYKQPKFEVTLLRDDRPRRLGEELRVEGTAVSYTEVPLEGATVRWSVQRSLYRPWWWRRSDLHSNDLAVAHGTAVVDADGLFSFTFTPLPDSNLELAYRPNFAYTVTAEVTDLSGETHNAVRTLRVGYESGHVHINTPHIITSPEQISYRTLNLDGDAVEMPVITRLERLAMPDERQRVLEKSTLEKSTLEKALAKGLATGRYRLTVTAVGFLGDTLADTAEFYLTLPSATLPATDEMLFFDKSKARLFVGDTLRLRLGTRLDSLELRLMASNSDSLFLRQRLVLKRGMKEMLIPVTEAMKGNFMVDVVAVQNNQVQQLTKTIEVPYRDKELSLRLTTFRDRLRPGEEERWTLTVEDYRNAPVRANAMLTMYDAALDSYRSLSWSLDPWQSRGFHKFFFYNLNYAYSRMGGGYPKGTYFAPHNTWGPIVLSLRLPSRRYYGYARGEEGMVMAAGTVQSRKSANSAVVEYEMEEEAEFVFAAADDAAPDKAQYESVSALSPTAESAEAPKPRSDFRTLAFFRPTLRTDSLGNADISFTVPDLLTRWSIHGMAWTREMATGSLSQSAVTQKELMLQVNKPRFLRLGDSVMLSAKITNMTDDTLSVETRFIASHTQREKDALLGGDAMNRVSTVVIPAHSSAAVSFPLKADSLGLIEYTLTASSGRHSDGERDAIAVLPARQRVTETMAMYINGTGEKDYTFAHLLHSDTSATLQHDSLSLAWVNSPILLVLDAFPHLKELENPSNIYRFNAYYCNRLWEDRLISLSTSQGDRLVSLSSQEDLQKLLAAQRPDGGWSWIPGGKESSLWTTTYIATGFGRLGMSMPKAVHYVDREEYEFYKKYYKNSKFRCEPSNISYLYMRSFHPSTAFPARCKEAYEFYYQNAKKHALEFEGLYTTAQLALVLHRGGDKALAKRLLNNLKQRSLTSDEMGMYWRDNRSGLFWTDRPLEVQALIIEAFREIAPNDQESIALMQQWLLKQKQTTRWESDVATANAIAALLQGNREEGRGNEIGNKEEGRGNTVSISFPDAGLTLTDTSLSSNSYSLFPTPYSLLARAHLVRTGKGPAWGSVSWSYYEEMDKIPASEMGIEMKRTLLKVNPDGNLTPTLDFRLGDRVRVRIEIYCDRNLEQLELDDQRPAAFEPLSTQNGWHWSWEDGLSYYNYITPTSTKMYIDRLDRGHYIVEYDVYCNNVGHYLLPPSQLSSLYAPAFRALAPAQRITVQ